MKWRDFRLSQHRALSQSQSTRGNGCRLMPSHKSDLRGRCEPPNSPPGAAGSLTYCMPARSSRRSDWANKYDCKYARVTIQSRCGVANNSTETHPPDAAGSNPTLKRVSSRVSAEAFLKPSPFTANTVSRKVVYNLRRSEVVWKG